MPVAFFTIGLVLGLGAALASWIVGLPLWAVILIYVLGTSLGALASGVAAYLLLPEDMANISTSEDGAHA